MAKNKVMFINPPQSCDSRAKFSSLKFPLGFLYMSCCLEKHGFGVKILDCPLYYKKKRKIDKTLTRIGLLPGEIKQAIKKYQPDIIGVSCVYTAYESDSFELISLIRELEKEINKKFLIVVGGAHTSANPKTVLRNKQIDIAVIGEGEETILEIADRYSKGEDLKKIRGTAQRVKDKIQINKQREYIQDLDSLYPAWHLLDMKLYFSHPDNSRATLRSPSVDIITSRGCPGNCVFCSIHTVWGRGWRGESPKKVVDGIEHLIKKYGVRQIRIQDDNLTLNRERTIKICDEIIKRKLDIRWDTPNGVAFWTLNENVLRKMRKAGYYRITFGIESASKKTQKYIRKNVNIDKISKLISFCHKIGLWVGATFIIGFPHETKEDIEETANFILNSEINFPFVYVAQPYSGTDLYTDFEREKLLSKVEQTSNIAKSQYDTLHFTNSQLNEMRNKIVKKFYIKKIASYANPLVLHREFLSKIRSPEGMKHVLNNIYTLAFKN